MLNAVIRLSLVHRTLVLACAGLSLLAGTWIALRLPVDVFPDLNRPTVTILTEAHGLAPEEVEMLVTLPVESVLNGAPGVARLRSSSGIGISIVYAEFAWGTDIYRNRQQVAERLSLLSGRLPAGMTPTMGPVTSIMGEIQIVGLASPDGSVSPMDLRTFADWTLRPRLMAVPGISQVVVIGGEVKQYQILVSSHRLSQRGISLGQLRESLEGASANSTGGFINQEGREFLIRPLGRIESIDDLRTAPVGMHLGLPVFVRDVAEVRVGAQPKRGEAGVSGRPAVVLTIQKQPGADTIALTGEVDRVLAEVSKTLPPGMAVIGDLFRQSGFIHAAIRNVEDAIRDGAIIVALVLVAFLGNLRTTLITLTAIPLSLVATAAALAALGLGINTMTLGGIAVAIGMLVDDAIVDVENVFRRLRENRTRRTPRPALAVIYDASREVRGSIVYATAIVIVVFLPLFALSGLEGRLFAPLGVAYIVALAASLLVSLTITPALCAWLLPAARATAEPADGRLVRWLKARERGVLDRLLRRPGAVLAGCGVLLAGALALVPFMGRSFLPAFNEGTATIGVASFPGIALPESDALGRRIEEAMLSIPEVRATTRRTGRAELDEHAEGVHWHEIDVDFHAGGRPRPVVLRELRARVEACGDVYVNVGQPIGHRLDHMLSGVRAQIAIKIFGPDLSELRRLAAKTAALIKDARGVVDLSVEPLVLIPQLKIAVDREEAGRLGLRSGALAEELETALNGEHVSRIIETPRVVDVVLRLDDASRATPAAIGRVLVKSLPTGRRVALSEVATVYPGTGPNMVSREQMQRRIVVSANASGRDLGGLVGELRRRLEEGLKLPAGYALEFGGQFESQQRASRLLLGFGTAALVAVVLLLYSQFRSWVLAGQIMLNVPLAMIGGLAGAFVAGREMSVATLIACITLSGIATRNGIMMISHYLHLMRHEGERFGAAMVVRGTLERLVPVLMTALAAALSLLPLVFAAGAPGKELLHPVAVVIVGGLISSTLLDLIVTPAVFLRFGRRSAERLAKSAAPASTGLDSDDRPTPRPRRTR